jgi:hypothetical protein
MYRPTAITLAQNPNSSHTKPKQLAHQTQTARTQNPNSSHTKPKQLAHKPDPLLLLPSINPNELRCKLKQDFVAKSRRKAVTILRVAAFVEMKV